MAKRIAKKVVWIGWDAADWKLINPMIDMGLMPNLEKMVNEGVMGNLATLDPPMSPTLWTAMATGKRPYKHGIHGFTEVDPSGESVRPSYITSRKVKAIWNMLQHHGLVTHQVGWWPSHPAEPTNGIYISNFWHKANKDPKNWPLPKDSVHPKEMEDIFAELRVHPKELTGAHLAPFVPLINEMDTKDPKLSKSLYSCQKITSDAASIQAAATYILANHEYDLMCVYFDAIDHYGHGFMKFNPPRRPHIPEKMYNYFKNVNVSGYRYHDLMLGRLLELAGDDAIVVLVSDHGFHPDHLRPKNLPLKLEPAAPAMEHSPYGIIVVKGPGIKKDERIYGASLIDMCPTILSMFGLPIAKDFDGKVLMSIYENPVEVDVIDSWEDVEGECGQHPKDIEVDQEQAKAELQQLIDLGYIEDPGPDKEAAVERTKMYNKYFLARAFVNGGRQEDALPLFEELWEENRDNPRFGIRLANVYMNLDMLTEARDIVDDIYELKINDSPTLNALNGTLLLKEKKPKQAVEIFEKVLESNAKAPGVHMSLAQGYMRIRRFKKAREAANKELEINYENPDAHRIIGRVQMAAKQYEEAAGSFLNAISLRYQFPIAHTDLGKALFHLGNYPASAQAFEVALTMFNQLNEAREWLITIYEEHIKNPEKVAELKKEIELILQSRKTAFVVSGFARSGTSIVMRMLEKGGQEIFVDDGKEADEYNPHGYYEHTKALANIHHDKNFLRELGDKVVKIYAPKLPFGPRDTNYKVIFVEREPTQTMLSMQKVKAKKNQDALDLTMFGKLTMQKRRIDKFLDTRTNLEVLKVSFDDLLNKTEDTAKKINEFMGGHLNVAEMVSAIDKSLIKEQTKETTIDA